MATSLYLPDNRLFREIIALREPLPEILTLCLSIWPSEEMRVTCIGRSWSEDAKLKGSGVHAAGPPWRAIDLRIFNAMGRAQQNIGRSLDEAQERAEEIAQRVNCNWQYDPERPGLKVAIASPHGTGPHIHLQVHPATVR